MQVVRENGDVNYLDQRFSRFNELHTALSAAGKVPRGSVLPGKKWFSLSAQDVEDRRLGLQTYLDSVLASARARHSREVEEFFDAPGRYDWPSQLAAVDTDVHDLPHLSSSTESWYLSAHVTCEGNEYSVFAWFYRVASSLDEDTRKVEYMHAVASAIIDVTSGAFHASTLLDPDAPVVLRDMLARSPLLDHTFAAAMNEILAKNSVPLPDRLADHRAQCDAQRLRIVMDGARGDNRVERQKDGSYMLAIRHPSGRGCDLTFRPGKAAVRHGPDGVVKGIDGEDTYRYFVPRCDVTGFLIVDPDGAKLPVEIGEEASGWFEHHFGGRPLDPLLNGPSRDEQPSAGGDHPGAQHEEPRSLASNACHLQLDSGEDVTATLTYDLDGGSVVDGGCSIVDAEGERTWHCANGVALDGLGPWRSTRTFQEFPTR
eukprot:COSAG01_NODE_1036_length_11988_cov_10.055345_5_plen_429_part_00